MTKPVGGRGNKAPYETAVMRVPVPLQSEVERMIEEYRRTFDNQLEPDEERQLYLTVLETCNRFSREMNWSDDKLNARTNTRSDYYLKLLNWLKAKLNN